jgi:predicted nucleotidyltransferase
MLIEAPSGLLSSELVITPVLERALEQCARRSNVDREAVLDLILCGDLQTHSAFRYALAKAVAWYLGELGATFRAVYVHGSAITDTAGPGSDIDVIVVVDRRCAEADRVIRLVDLALTNGYRRLTGFCSLSSLLDVHVVDLEEEREGRGFGAVLHSSWAAPLCLWRGGPARSGALEPYPTHRTQVSLTPR